MKDWCLVRFWVEYGRLTKEFKVSLKTTTTFGDLGSLYKATNAFIPPNRRCLHQSPLWISPELLSKALVIRQQFVMRGGGVPLTPGSALHSSVWRRWPKSSEWVKRSLGMWVGDFTWCIVGPGHSSQHYVSLLQSMYDEDKDYCGPVSKQLRDYSQNQTSDMLSNLTTLYV